MLSAILIQFASLFVMVFNLLILARVLMSWINPNPAGGIGSLIVDVTEPVLAPIRRLMPKNQLLDFSPLVAFLILQIISLLVDKLAQNY